MAADVPLPSSTSTYYRVGEFLLMETLGTGGFGKVKLAKHVRTNNIFACKILNKSVINGNHRPRHVQNEISTMRRMRHPNTVSLFHVLTSSEKIYLFMEYVPFGPLYEEVYFFGGLTEPYARYFFHQLIDGLEYCHYRGVYHRDLKPDNLLLGVNGILKISDFGLATFKGRCNPVTGSITEGTAGCSTQCGSPHYIPPEIISVLSKPAQSYSGARADYWSCGVLLYTLVSGKLPYEAKNFRSLFKKILITHPKFPSYFSSDLKDLIISLIRHEPEERITLAAVKRHPWYNGPIENRMPGYRPRFVPASQAVPPIEPGEVVAFIPQFLTPMARLRMEQHLAHQPSNHEVSHVTPSTHSKPRPSASNVSPSPPVTHQGQMPIAHLPSSSEQQPSQSSAMQLPSSSPPPEHIMATNRSEIDNFITEAGATAVEAASVSTPSPAEILGNGHSQPEDVPGDPSGAEDLRDCSVRMNGHEDDSAKRVGLEYGADVKAEASAPNGKSDNDVDVNAIAGTSRLVRDSSMDIADVKLGKQVDEPVRIQEASNSSFISSSRGTATDTDGSEYYDSEYDSSYLSGSGSKHHSSDDSDTSSSDGEGRTEFGNGYHHNVSFPIDPSDVRDDYHLRRKRTSVRSRGEHSRQGGELSGQDTAVARSHADFSELGGRQRVRGVDRRIRSHSKKSRLRQDMSSVDEVPLDADIDELFESSNSRPHRNKTEVDDVSRAMSEAALYVLRRNELGIEHFSITSTSSSEMSSEMDTGLDTLYEEPEEVGNIARGYLRTGSVSNMGTRIHRTHSLNDISIASELMKVACSRTKKMDPLVENGPEYTSGRVINQLWGGMDLWRWQEHCRSDETFPLSADKDKLRGYAVELNDLMERFRGRPRLKECRQRMLQKSRSCCMLSSLVTNSAHLAQSIRVRELSNANVETSSRIEKKQQGSFSSNRRYHRRYKRPSVVQFPEGDDVDGNTWVASVTDRIAWCKYVGDFDFIQDEDEFGMDSVTLSKAWSEKLTEESLQPLSFGTQFLESNTYVNSRSAQFLSAPSKGRRRRRRRRALNLVSTSSDLKELSVQSEQPTLSQRGQTMENGRCSSMVEMRTGVYVSNESEGRTEKVKRLHEEVTLAATSDAGGEKLSFESRRGRSFRKRRTRQNGIGKEVEDTSTMQSRKEEVTNVPQHSPSVNMGAGMENGVQRGPKQELVNEKMHNGEVNGVITSHGNSDLSVNVTAGKMVSCESDDGEIGPHPMPSAGKSELRALSSKAGRESGGMETLHSANGSSRLEGVDVKMDVLDRKTSRNIEQEDEKACATVVASCTTASEHVGATNSVGGEETVHLTKTGSPPSEEIGIRDGGEADVIEKLSTPRTTQKTIRFSEKSENVEQVDGNGEASHSKNRVEKKSKKKKSNLGLHISVKRRRGNPSDPRRIRDYWTPGRGGWDEMLSFGSPAQSSSAQMMNPYMWMDLPALEAARREPIHPFRFSIPSPLGKDPPRVHWVRPILLRLKTRRTMHLPYMVVRKGLHGSFHTKLDLDKSYSLMMEVLDTYGCVASAVALGNHRYVIRCWWNSEIMKMYCRVNIFRVEEIVHVEMHHLGGRREEGEFLSIYNALRGMFWDKVRKEIERGDGEDEEDDEDDDDLSGGGNMPRRGRNAIAVDPEQLNWERDGWGGKTKKGIDFGEVMTEVRMMTTGGGVVGRRIASSTARFRKRLNTMMPEEEMEFNRKEGHSEKVSPANTNVSDATS